MSNMIGYQETEELSTVDCDAVVIGSGAGGAAIATELQEGGLDVVILEEGPLIHAEDYSTDSSDIFSRVMRDGGSTVIFGRSPIAYVEGRCVGGSTVVNGGMCWRTPDKILRRWQMENGLAEYTSKKLEPIFEHVEAIINARTQDAGSDGMNNGVFKRGCDRLGYRTVRNIRNQTHCVGASECATGCPTGAKQSTLKSYVPRFLRAGGRLIYECKAEKLILNGGKACGIRGRFVNPHTRKPDRSLVVHAALVVLAGGATQSPLFLLRNGLGRGAKHIGKHFTVHPNIKMMGLFDEEIHNYRGTHQAWQCREFQEEGILLATGGVSLPITAMGLDLFGREHAEIMKDYRFMSTGGILVDDHASGSVSLGPFGLGKIRYDITDVDQEKFIRAAVLLAEVYFEAGARKVFLPFRGVPPLSSMDDARKLFDKPPKVQHTEYFTAHIMGTCRMHVDPNQGVVNQDGEMHSVPNLFVTDASTLATAVGVNPQETIMMLATRSARVILENRGRYLDKRPYTQAA